MKENKIAFVYCGVMTTVDLRRVVAISEPEDSGMFRIYFENAIWRVRDSEYEKVFNAWVAL